MSENHPAYTGDIIVQQPRPPAPLEPEPPAFRVLTLVARPLDQQALPEIGDAWSLADRLAQLQAPVELAFARPPTVETLRRRLADDWDVVHFDGHGVWAWTCPDCGAFIPKEEGQPDPSACPRCDAPLTEPPTGYLAFERDDGLVEPLPATEMAALLCPQGSPPRARLAILTACQSAMGSPSLADVLLAAGVPAVLAMRESVTVEAVVALLPPFYANLGAGRTPRQALDAALPALGALGASPFSGTPWADLPVLEGPGAEVPLCEPGRRNGTRVEREPLVGVPAPSPSGAFHGDFEQADPPGGRKGYLVRLARALLRGEKLVVLTGVGGIGKSALAAAAARRMAWQYPGGVLWVDGRDYLETGMRLENLLSIFGHVYGQEFGQLPVARQRELAMDYLRRIQAPALLVVDNADVADETVWRFLQDAPRPSAVLVTTRTAPEYGACVLDVAAMTPREGLTFLAAEIGRRRDDPLWALGLEDTTAGKLLEVAELLDGHALALLQAAALAGDMGLNQALAQVRANPARGETARRFDFSYESLPEPRKELLHRLAAFAADFDLQAIAAICSPPPELGEGLGVGAWDAELPELVRGSFVERHPLGPDYDRFRLHPVMREYLRRRAGPEAMAAHDRCFARYFLALADWGWRQLGDPETALQAVALGALERANLLAAQQACLAQALWDEAVSLAYRLNDLFERTGHWADRRRVLEAGIEAARKGEARRDEAGLAHNLGALAQAQGDYTEARRLYGEALDIKQQLGDRPGVATTLHNLGMLAQDQGDYAEARRLYGEAAETFEQLGAQREQASVLHNLGVLAQAQGDYAEARRRYGEALDIRQQLGDRAGVAQTLGQLGTLARLQGDYPEARHLYQRSLDISQQLGDRVDAALMQLGLGNVAQNQGDYAEAERQWQAALVTFRELGDRKNEAGVLHQLGMLAQAQGDYAEARRLYGEAAETFEQLGAQQEQAAVLHNLGRLAQDQGDYAEAHRLYGESLDIEQQLGNRAGVAQTLHNLGALAQAQGDYAEARRLYGESLDIEQQLGNRAGVALSQWGLGNLAQDQGDYAEAERQWQAALATFRELGDRKNEAGVLHNLGMLAEKDGNLEEAERLFAESLATLEALHSPDAAVARHSLQRVRDRLERKSH
jgi:tetratricopeptide (TPR) repeat protein